eukprot:TRINITY_DN58051_c0_g1_i2.p1 TRINITY_DN58051_c0_g1~~TRINITY_DN58051_c0_g1_i2.p1  ORF type:complete len:325 (+),score=31.86 TRINITY_DN58051_c0_g1_i2:36-1010(+)
MPSKYILLARNDINEMVYCLCYNISLHSIPVHSPTTIAEGPPTDSNSSWTTKLLPQRGPLLVIPLAGKFTTFPQNLWCSLKKANVDTSAVTFVALDQQALEALTAIQLPVTVDDRLPLLVLEGGGNSFDQITCNKLAVVVHLLQLGHDVLLSDADVTFLKDPMQFLSTDFDITFSFGGHFNPLLARPAGTTVTTPSCNKTVTAGRCYANTGLYHARPTPAAIDFFDRANSLCQKQAPTKLGDKNDATYVNELLEQDHRDGKQPAYRMGCFNPCVWTNGNTFFHHKIADKVGQDTIVSVHANFMTGAAKKKAQLQHAGLWRTTCK